MDYCAISKQHFGMLSGKNVGRLLFPSQLQICHGNPNHLHRLKLLYQSCPQSPSTIQADYLPNQRSSICTMSCCCWWHRYAVLLLCL